MSIKSKVFAAAATLTLIGGVGAAGATSASAATPSCGPTCIEIFNHDFGTHAHPNFVLDVLRQGEKVGQPLILFRAANSDPAEDFTVSYQGLVSDFFAAGLVSAGGGPALRRHGSTLPDAPTTADDPAFEIEYAPYGVDSGLCVGVASTAAQGSKVTLQPCGVSAKTVWIVDIIDSPRHDPPRLRPADQRLGHELLAPVRADLPGGRFPDRQAAAAAVRQQPDRFLQRRRPDRGHRERQPALGRRLRRPGSVGR